MNNLSPAVNLTPLAGQSRNKGQQAIEAILALQKSRDAYKTRISDLERLLCRDGEAFDIVDTNLELDDVRAKVSQLNETIKHRRAALGIDGRKALSKLKSDQYLTAKMNALAVKRRIRDRLRQRKFELERLERSYRQTVNSYVY